MLKPKHQGGYTDRHADLCERTLVTLLRGLGPWKEAIYLTGGLAPRFLIPRDQNALHAPPPHAGTTDVDLVLDREQMATVQAYQRLEQNLKSLGFVRGTNDTGRAQHFSWRKQVDAGVTVVVDLLCDASQADGGQVIHLTGERRLSALAIPGVHLVVDDFFEVELTADLLDERGVATERVRVANIAPFIILKALAYDDRFEEKDAYDLVYCLTHYPGGHQRIAAQFANLLVAEPVDALVVRALEILRSRFATDEATQGYRKDGPVSYARFLADPGRPEQAARHQRDAAAVVETFLKVLDTHQQRGHDPDVRS